ncbi:MAG: glycine--tRNA ligase [Candidatus Aenigmarchaeota archaeon CG1_02_38_14]|nr:MAG: glycine--tRNA ligase [Candidatus Aenigmarchaeota archaeon CG1_02_38_14]
MATLQDVQTVCLTRGIIFPTAEIYSGLSGFFDYGHVGTLIKQKFINYWRETFVKSRDNVFEIDGSTILPEKVLIASGHVDSFVDPIAQCKKCKSIHRADHLIEEKTGEFVEGKSCGELTKIIQKSKLLCPSCKGELMDVRVFHLMFKTDISPTGGQAGYLRPETAQNIFTAFNRIYRTTRSKLPMGIAQVGHSFRNEISPRNFIVRVREFNQMEVEMFFDPRDDKCEWFDEVKDVEINLVTQEAQKQKGEMIKISVNEALAKGIIPNQWLAYFLAREFIFYKSLGIPEDALRFRHMLPEETPHYSKGNFDLEIRFDFGWKETVGNAYRTDHDLKSHMKHSGKDLSVLTEDGRKIICHVVEPSFGVERTIAGVLLHNFVEDKERGWNWFKFPARIAPYICAVFPLQKKDSLPEKAKGIIEDLKKDGFDVFYDEAGSIGKRYARADEIGCPFAVTVDYNTLKDNTVTIRNRDSTKQVRIHEKDLRVFLEAALRGLE